MHDNDEDDDVTRPHVPTLADAVNRLRFTLSPTLYTDEDSDTSALLMQQILEQRAVRGWLIVIWVTIVGLITLGALTTIVVLSLTNG